MMKLVTSRCRCSRLGWESSSPPIFWLIITKVWSPRWSSDLCVKREEDITNISSVYQFDEVIRWEYKDNLLDTYPINDIQTKMIHIFDKLQPSIIFSPGPWDLNFEHTIAFNLVEMASNPIYSPYIKKIVIYEIPSSTELSFRCSDIFQPNFYVDISRFIEAKKENCTLYTTEIKEYPHPRSIEGIEVTARQRGMECGLQFAEAFRLVRGVVL